MDRKKLLENTVYMYRRTLSEMQYRGEDTSLVEAALSEAEANLLYAVSGNTVEVGEEKFMSALKRMEIPIPDNLLFNTDALKPIRTNLFIVRFLDIPYWQVKSVNVYKGEDGKQYASIECIETADFCVKKYVDENNLQGEISIEYLTPYWKTIRKDTMTVITATSQSAPIDYSVDDILKTIITCQIENYGITTY